MNKIRFSVIIPAFNAAPTLIQSVASCLNQSDPPHEVIVVDDGSRDDTQVLLAQHFSGKINVITLPENSGPAHARNCGIQAASGQYIAFQDADDIWHPNKLEIIGNALSSHPHIKFLFHPFRLETEETLPLTHQLSVVKYPFWKLLLRNPIGTPCAIFARHPELNFNEHFHYMEDYELFLNEAERNGVYKLNYPLTTLGRPVLSAGGQSSNRWAMRKGEIKAWWSFASRHPKYFTLVFVLSLYGLMKHCWKWLSHRKY